MRPCARCRRGPYRRRRAQCGRPPRRGDQCAAHASLPEHLCSSDCIPSDPCSCRTHVRRAGAHDFFLACEPHFRHIWRTHSHR
eukprot:5982218-Pleurochrysis_carterae.AAC.5